MLCRCRGGESPLDPCENERRRSSSNIGGAEMVVFSPNPKGAVLERVPSMTSESD